MHHDLHRPVRGRPHEGRPAPRRLAACLAACFATALVAGSPAALAADKPTSARPTDGAIVMASHVVRPGDDFFRYVNGEWLDRTDIPADRGAWSSGAELAERVDRQVADLIREAAASGTASGDVRRIADYFHAYMDEAAIEAAGIAPVRPLLDRIDAIRDRRGLSAELGRRLRADVDPLNATKIHTENLFGMWVAQGFHDPTRYHAYLLQGGLGMPDREYYLADDERMKALREKYVAHVATMFEALGMPEARRRAEAVVGLETRIARGHAKLEDTENVATADNTWARKDFARRAPGMDWQAYFSAAGLSGQRDFIVWQPGAFKASSALVASAPLETWKDYLRFHTVNMVADVLPKRFADAHFAFFGTALGGTPQQLPRWKRAVDATNAAVGDAVGKLYVERHFPAASKARIERMVANIVDAFGKRIDRLDWMAPETKTQAQAKLKTLHVGIGYPDRWRSYDGLEVRAGDAAGNELRVAEHEFRRQRTRLGKAVDREEWCMTPQTVNAVNMPMQNALNFPAAILLPPFFDPEKSDAYNYGAIGATIGHEISHSFDDQGAQFDAQGRLRNWWRKDDLAHFQAASEALAKQYSAYRPFPDLAVNGRQTLSENIADLAGIGAAYDAMRKAIGRPAAEQGDADDRVFFAAYAESWRTKQREASLRRQIATNGHAPAQYRALTVRNLDAWYRSYDVLPDQGLYLAPQQRVRIW